MPQQEPHTDIYYKLGEIHGGIKRLDEKTENILAQTTKTNGRVTVVEKEIADIKLKIAYWSGGFAVALFILKELIVKYT